MRIKLNSPAIQAASIAAVVVLVSLAGCPAPNDAPSEGEKSTRPAPAAVATRKPQPPPTPKTAGHQSPVPPQEKTKTVEPSKTPAVENPAANHPYGKKPDPLDDPVARAIRLNGPVFENWPRPKLALVLSGRQDGYLEPCGCSGLENQKGGLARRHTLLKQLRDRGWPVVALDTGGLVHRTGKQAERKYQHTVDALATLGYDAVGLGPMDLNISGVDLLATLANVKGGRKMFVSANLSVAGQSDGQFIQPWRVVEAGGIKLGVTAVLGESEAKKFENDLIEYTPPKKALDRVLPRLKQAGCDLLVLLAFAPVKEARQLAAAHADFDLVVAAGDAETPPAAPIEIEGTRTRIVELGYKGMYVCVLALYDDPRAPVRYQRVPLDARFESSPEMHQMMVAYQRELEQLGWDQLALPPVPHTPQRKFVGSKTCGQCHTAAMKIWEHTPHAHGTDTLVRLDPPRHFDPECISCHSTGWHPQKYFPYTSGFRGLKTTPALRQVGCENCHGPGSRHVAVESGDLEVTEEEQRQLRQQMRLPYKSARDRCVQCHDYDNSPAFHKPGAFEKYWARIKHEGKE